MTKLMEDGWDAWAVLWGSPFRTACIECLANADAGHGVDHIERVVVNAIRIGREENAEPAVVMPAAWLHDCVSVPKSSPDRHLASRLAADRALEILSSLNYPDPWNRQIHHAIAAHSFSAGIACESIDARVVQDADRLEALGAIGMARCFMTGGAMLTSLYHVDQPMPLDRPSTIESTRSITSLPSSFAYRKRCKRKQVDWKQIVEQESCSNFSKNFA